MDSLKILKSGAAMVLEGKGMIKASDCWQKGVMKAMYRSYKGTMHYALGMKVL